MFELLFVVAFFLMLLATGVSLLGIIAALMVATLVMFFGGIFALMIKVLPWLLLAVAVVWVIRTVKAPKVPDSRRASRYSRTNRWRY
ncbi:envelope stress response protein PspG [Cronobacter turicensis]|uniref:envelope stress response protein PspG n=1 Tax=Cronobacter turicensis TaxID=413502 RepID=UPI001D5F323A|nr:envelope stress response protein PspG [Cronobacter turicensis]EGT5682817.1 envelope stress response protein PspG [Cronobacter turicensis]EGT5741687.1 envelope stress response protein PspG [Cronobacter turicensis]ELY6319940.1 envelope stress response protein PspG [Cronobacter turicensis]MDI6433255.1 envelope stress response protein PspG [Cronobacter turicensis]